MYREKPLVFVYLEAVSCLTVLKNYPKSRTNAKELILRSISALFSALIPLLVDKLRKLWPNVSGSWYNE